MQKIIFYIKKILNKFVLYSLLLLMFLVLAIALNRCEKEKDPYIQKQEEETKLIKDMENLTEEEAFPKVDLNADTIIEETKDYANKNFLQLDFNNNENQNVVFKIAVPKNSITAVGETKTKDPFDLTNQEAVTVLEVKDDNAGMFGTILVSNTSLELDPADMNTFLIKDALNLVAFKNNGGAFINGIWNDVLAINPNSKEVTRIKTIRNSSLYYTMYFTFKDFYEYIKYAKDVSIMFESFELRNPIDNVMPTKFSLLKSKKFDMLYPKGWSTNERYDKEEKVTSINIRRMPNEDTLFNIRLYEDNNKTNESVSEEFLERLRNIGGISFDDIDKNKNFYSDNDIYVFSLLNAKNINGEPVDVYCQIHSKDDKKVLGVFITKRLENESYLLFAENKRFLNIFSHTVKISFFEGDKLENTAWINIYNEKQTEK